MRDTSNQIRVPRFDPDFFILDEDKVNLDRFEKMSARHPVNILTTGNQGCGKSSLVRQFASLHKRPLATFQVGLLLESGQLFGQTRLKKGETYYREFLFPRAIQTPGCVVHLEEINRPEHPKALNMLFSILSEDRQAWTDELGHIKVADEVVFFATLNEGEEFVGTEMLDAALRDRFYVSVLDYLPLEIETKVLHLKGEIDPAEAQTIVNIANKLRTNTQEPMIVSTRHTLMIAEMVSVGAPVKDAFINSLQISKDIIESVLLSLHVELGLKETSGGKGYQLY